jgi:hypothetical protein
VPADYGMPPSGVFAESEAAATQTSQWLIGEIDLEKVAALRREGQVALYRDWPEQFGL